MNLELKKYEEITSSVTKWVKNNALEIKKYLIPFGVVVICWAIVTFLANTQSCHVIFITDDLDSLRTLIASAFQGLAAFFAIIVSVSLLVTQLAYGTFSPRLMPNFLENKVLVTTGLLFIGALSLNLFILAYLSPETVEVLQTIILVTLATSVLAIIAVVPASFALFKLAHPMTVGWNLIRRFDSRYFDAVPFKSDKAIDSSLPLLQSLTIKAIKEADTDFAKRLIGSFDDTLSKHFSVANAKKFSDYFGSYIRKVAITASELDEEQLLIQLMYMNEELEEKAMASDQYLLDSRSSHNGSTFVGNIAFIIELSIKNRHHHVVGMALGALHRLRNKVILRLSPDNEMSSFILGEHFRSKKDGKPNITDQHRKNEYIFEYIQRTYFSINIGFATTALEHNPRSVERFIREISSHRYSFSDLANKDQHREAIKRIAYNDLYNLVRITRSALKANVNLADCIATDLQEADDYLLEIDTNLVEGYIDILGHLIIESIQYDMYDADPDSIIYSTGVVLRSFSKPNAPDEITVRLLNHLDKALEVLAKKQDKYPSPLYEKMRNKLCDEISTAKNWHKESVEIGMKVDTILKKFNPDQDQQANVM